MNGFTWLELLQQANPQVMGKSKIKVEQLSPAALAYLGDAVYELYIRTYYLLPPKNIKALHGQVVAQVRAETQAAYLKTIQPYLTEAEANIVRRGRNAAQKKTSRRLSLQQYQQATGFETLIGYLYLTNTPRLQQLLQLLQ